VNLWFCVWLLRDSKAELFRVAPITQRKDNVWSGFGGLSSDQLKECYDERLKFTVSDIELGSELWGAFQAGDHTRLKGLSKTESACFPYLKEVCEAEIEKDTRPKRVLGELRQQDIEDFGEMFAAFRERAGRDTERIHTQARTAADLYGELAKRHGFADSMTRCKVAINDELADWNVSLTAGDEVLFFPPVAGG